MMIVENLNGEHVVETTAIQIPAHLISMAERNGIDVTKVCQAAIIAAVAEKAWNSPMDTAAQMDKRERERTIAAGKPLASGEGPADWS